MKRSKEFKNGYGTDFSVPLFDDQQPTGIAEASPRLRNVRAPGAADERQCSHCGSWAVQPLGVIYASSSQSLAALSPYGVATPSLAQWVACAYPPEKMATWNGFTLSLLLWPPCLFLLGIYVYGWLTGSAVKENALLYVTGAAVGVVSWSLPALLRKRAANQHNEHVWEPAMRKWRTSHMCLKCGRI